MFPIGYLRKNMINNRNTVIFLLFILVTLFLRDVPYLNVFFVNKLWIFYLFLLAFFLIYMLRAKLKYLIYLCLALIIPTLLFILVKLNYFADAVGIFVYFFLWIVVAVKIYSLIRSKE